MQLTAFCKPALSYCFADHDCVLLLVHKHAAMPSCSDNLVLMFTICGRFCLHWRALKVHVVLWCRWLQA